MSAWAAGTGINACQFSGGPSDIPIKLYWHGARVTIKAIRRNTVAKQTDFVLQGLG